MKKLSIIDFIIIIGVIIVLAVGFFTAKHMRQTADKQIEATSAIEFEVFLRGVTVTDQDFPIKPNDRAFITIRNVPYTELTVVDVVSQPRKTLSPAARGLTIVNDPSQMALYDAVIRITDTAKITKDGAVVGGNKIKMGLPVVLEGKAYKFSGTISSVRVKSDVDIKDSGENSNVG